MKKKWIKFLKFIGALPKKTDTYDATYDYEKSLIEKSKDNKAR